MTKTSHRFIVVSGYFPPLVGGTSTVMATLLSAFRPDAFRVVSESLGGFDGVHNATVPPDVVVDRIGVPTCLRAMPFIWRVVDYARFALIPAITKRIVSNARAIDATRIVAVYPSWPFLIAAWQAHLQTGLPLITYHMDVTPDPESASQTVRRAIIRYEADIFRAAQQRLVLSEAVGNVFARRYGMPTVTIPHAIVPVEPPASSAGAQSDAGNLIVHTGVIESLQEDTLRQLARVIAGNPALGVRLVCSTPTPADSLRQRGFNLPGVEFVSLAHPDVLKLQHSAQIAVAVLPFSGMSTDVVATAFPTKLVEYMNSGTPILVIAPADSFLACDATEHGYACVLTDPSEDTIKHAITQLLTDSALRLQLTTRARQTLLQRHALSAVARNFASACGIDSTCLRT